MNVDRLPPDNYGVRVTCRDDRVRLLWLANEVGEERLRISVRKYQRRFIGTMPYVSKMLRWHRLEVPVEVCVPQYDSVRS
jgi:hypothetical protein